MPMFSTESLPRVLEQSPALAAQPTLSLPALATQDPLMPLSERVQQVITEVFEKSTMQHHFIEAYADLCKQLEDHLSGRQSGNGLDPDFSSLLLAGCHAAFKRAFAPPKGLRKRDAATRELLEKRCKARMIGTIRFVGALLVRDLLPINILFVLLDEFLQDPTPQSTEALATLLTAVGPTFDNPHWGHHVALSTVFTQVRQLADAGPGSIRDRRPLKVLLALRAADWQSEGPAGAAAVKPQRGRHGGRSRGGKGQSPTSKASASAPEDSEQESTCGDSMPASSEADADVDP